MPVFGRPKQRATLLLLAWLGAYSPAVYAQDADRCIVIESSLDRLACYDEAHGRTPSVQKLENGSPGAWRVTQETSKLTDEKTVVVSVASTEVIDCGWNKGARITLVARCMENTTSMYFVTNCHMTDSVDDYGQITYRIDDEKARTAHALASTDNRALGLWSGSRSIPVIKQLLGKNTLITRMTPFSENPFTATFPIRGLETAIAPLRKACNW